MIKRGKNKLYLLLRQKYLLSDVIKAISPKHYPYLNVTTCLKSGYFSVINSDFLYGKFVKKRKKKENINEYYCGFYWLFSRFSSENIFIWFFLLWFGCLFLFFLSW